MYIANEKYYWKFTISAKTCPTQSVAAFPRVNPTAPIRLPGNSPCERVMQIELSVFQCTVRSFPDGHTARTVPGFLPYSRVRNTLVTCEAESEFVPTEMVAYANFSTCCLAFWLTILFRFFVRFGLHCAVADAIIGLWVWFTTNYLSVWSGGNVLTCRH